MAIKTTKNYYEALSNDNVKFLQGTQAQLNKYFLGSGDDLSGKAVEGAFYLTTDTHRLYIGRKVSSTTNAPTGAKVGDVYPEEVSTGISVVDSTNSLPSTGANEAHDGDFYYIQDRNILAAYNSDTKQWVQINTPTGINKISSKANTSGDDVLLKTEIETAAGSKVGQVKFKKGDNITLTAGETTTIDEVETGEIIISAKDTTYTIGSAANATNGNAKIGLKENGTGNLQNPVTITGAGTVGVTSDASGNITVTGPTFSNISFEGKTTNGIVATLNGTSGNGNASITASGEIDPQITYGNGTKSTAHFKTSGAGQPIIADLDVYTKAQADSAIDKAIDDKLAVANAMTYKGVITSSEDLKTKIVTNRPHNGDTYKVGALTGEAFQIGDVTVHTGDLIILNGTEDSSGEITLDGAPITASTSYTNAFSICELIPSGDEPLVTSSVNTPATSGKTAADAARTTLYDGKAGSEENTNILTTRYLSGDKITVKSASTNRTTGQDVSLTFNHDTTTRADESNVTVSNAGTSNVVLRKSTADDTIGNDGYELFVFSDPTKALTTDEYGHVTSFKGKKITFKHNKLKTFTTSYGNDTSSNKKIGIIGISTTDTLNNTKETQIKVASSTLSVAGDATANQLNVELQWGSF